MWLWPFTRDRAEDPTVTLTPEVILGTDPLATVDTDPATGALRCSAVAAAEAFIVDAMGSLPIISYDRESKARAEANPAYAILKQKPNDWTTPFMFWSAAWRRAIRRGNAFIYPRWNGAGRLDSLHLLNNHQVDIQWNRGRKQFLYDKKYVIDAPNLIHLVGFSEDGLTGQPLLKYAEHAVGLSILAEDYGEKFFSEGEQPGGAWVGVPFSDAKKISLVSAAIRAWKEKRHAVPIIPEGGEIHAPVANNEQAQFLQLRQFQVIEVARFMRVPPHIIYHYMTGGTYANLEQQSIDLVTNCLQRWITQGEQEISRVVYGATGTTYAEYLVDARLRGDTLSRMQSYEVGIRTHVMTPNECRRRENLPPLPGGDEFPTMPGAPPQTPPTPPAATEATRSTRQRTKKVKP